MPASPAIVMRCGADAVRNAPGRHAGECDHERADGQDEPDHGRVEPQRAREIERADHQRRHHHGRDERAHGEACAQRRIAQHRQPDQRRRGTRLGAHEEAGADDGSRQQSRVERTETAASRRHRERVGCERQRKKQRAHSVEAGRVGRGIAVVDRQVPPGEREGQDAERCGHQKDRAPAESGDQYAAERRPQRGADRGHRSQQPHGAAGPGLRNRLADEGDGEGHHDGRTDTLHRAGGDEKRQRGRDAAQDRGPREHEDSAQQQPAATGDVAEPPDADDQRRDGEEVREHDPLDLLERGVERLRERRQTDVRDARAERRQQHGKGKAGERPPYGRRPPCPFGNRPDLHCHDRLRHELHSVAPLVNGAMAKASPLHDIAEDARFALYSCV